MLECPGAVGASMKGLTAHKYMFNHCYIAPVLKDSFTGNPSTF